MRRRIARYVASLCLRRTVLIEVPKLPSTILTDRAVSAVALDFNMIEGANPRFYDITVIQE
jgi:hypothetical protein